MNMQQEETKALEIIQPHALEMIERAQIDMQIATAKKYPRDLAAVKKRMLSFATLDEETAESCFYTLRRKDQDGGTKLIQGPSVRLAEIAVACYQNLRAASRIIDNDGKSITSQGICHDLENNTLISVETKRRITDKKGRTYSEDMQVTTGNAANSIAFRNAVLKVIPGALVKPVYEAAKAVAVGGASTLSVKRDKVVRRLNSMGVENERILRTLNKSSVENIDLADLEVLIGLGTAIKDGDTTVDEAFPLAKPDAIRTSVSLDDVKASAEQNRGHDATVAPKPQDALAPTQTSTPAPEPTATTAPAAAAQQPASDEPPAALPNLAEWPDNPQGEWLKIQGKFFRWNEEAGNFQMWVAPAAEPPVEPTPQQKPTAPRKPVFGRKQQ